MSESNTLTLSGQFSIKVRVGNAEIEVSAPDRTFVLDESNRLIEQLKIGVATTSPVVEVLPGEVTLLSASRPTRAEKPETLAEFFRQFSPQTNLDKTLIFGYWCEIKQGQPHFTPDDIVAKYKEVREKPPENLGRDLKSLLSKGLLLPPDKAEDGNPAYSLSRSGINEVESKMSKG